MESHEYSYVEAREGVRYVRGSRVPVESLIWLWRDGQSAETIREAYPTLRLAEVYGAIAYYLDHQEVVDAYLREEEVEMERLQAENEAAHPEFFARMRQRLAEARAARAAASEPPIEDAHATPHETPAP
jgi:uncharacterized protein (DUF433 family)